MAAGFPLTREVIDNFSADRARQVQSALSVAQKHHLWLSGVSDGDLLALGYSQGDVDTLRGTYLALDKLARIATAQEVQAAPDDFLWNAKKLIGPHF